MKTRRAKPPAPTSHLAMSHCTLYGVKWDKPALETVQTVANALLNLTALFRATGLDVPMVQVIGGEPKVNAKP